MGFLLGYGLKKVAALLIKLLALVSGLFMLGLAWLASIGVITLNFNVFTSAIGSTFANAVETFIGSMALFAQILPMGGSFGVGFYFGAKKG